MLSSSFQQFFINPVKELKAVIVSYLQFVFHFIKDTILLKNMAEITDDDIRNETFKIFKFLIYCLLTNVAINEAFLQRDSDWLHELKSEVGYLSFFYISFIFIYYVANLYQYITKNHLHKIISVKNWLLITIMSLLIFQISGALNPTVNNDKLLWDQTFTNDALVLFLIVSVVMLIQFVRLIRSGQVKWYDFIFYIVIWILYFIMLILNGLVVQLLVGVK